VVVARNERYRAARLVRRADGIHVIDLCTARLYSRDYNLSIGSIRGRVLLSVDSANIYLSKDNGEIRTSIYLVNI
jgi:hypothetical protein